MSILKAMIAVLTGSWKTTIVGFLSGVAVLVLPILEAGRVPTLHEWLLAVVLTFLGVVAKDFNKTGSGKKLVKNTDQFPDHGAS
ncbi:MAG: hypothetical protein AB9866_21630 [Syntrophobacteraceae bacterium]